MPGPYQQGPQGVPGYPPGSYAAAPVTGYPGYSTAPQTDSKAIVGLILAIASWLVCPIILAIIALVLASQSNKAIAASGGRLEGRGMNTATKWISWINIVLYIIGFIVFIGFMFFAVSQDPAIFDFPTMTPFPLETEF